MKIAICSVQVPFIRGGAEILTETLYKEMLKRDYDVELINIPFKWYPSSQIIRSALAWRLIDITESNGEKIDLAICTKFPSYIVKHKNKVVWLFHQYRQAYDLYGTEYHSFDPSSEGENMRKRIIDMDNIVLRESKKIFTISKNVSNRLKRYNNIGSEHLYPPPANADRLHCDSYGDYILCPSRLDKTKRQDILIKSMRYVKSDIKCKIVGRGPMKGEYISLAKKLNVCDRIEFLEYINDDVLIKLYADSLAVFFAPFDEDYGYITVEGFLSRKPVITTIDSGGPLEFVENMTNGYVVPVDPKNVAKVIDYLYMNKDVAKKMGNSGYDSIKEKNISWDNIIQRLVVKR